jgi:hypothetical protein
VLLLPILRIFLLFAIKQYYSVRDAMNSYAHRTGHTFYKNTGIEKRDTYQDPPKRLYKNFETIRRAYKGTGSGNGSYTGTAVDSIVQFFKGTVVNGDVSGIEWGKSL